MAKPSASPGSTLEVLSGIHAGVTIALEPADYSVGSTPSAQIVLRDPGVQPLHASLRIERGGVRIQAIGGDVRLDDGQLLPKGFGAKLRLPTTLAFGDAQLRLTPIDGATSRKDAVVGQIAGVVAEHPRLIATGMLGCMLLITLASGLPSASRTVSPLDRTALRSSTEADPALPRSKPPVAQTADLKTVADELSARLKSAGLDALKVTTGDRRVVVSGSLATREAAAWVDAQRWFDDNYAGRIVLTAAVAIGEARSMPTALRLQAIWFGERPYVITEEGLRYYQGAFLDNGWIIQEISENRVVLARNGETMALTYR